MTDLSESSVAQNRNMATDWALGKNLGTRPQLGHYVRLQGGGAKMRNGIKNTGFKMAFLNKVFNLLYY